MKAVAKQTVYALLEQKRKCSIRNQVPGSISFVPSVAGLMIAGEIVREIIGIES